MLDIVYKVKTYTIFHGKMISSLLLNLTASHNTFSCSWSNLDHNWRLNDKRNIHFLYWKFKMKTHPKPEIDAFTEYSS